MKTTRVLAPGEFEETGDFESESGRYPPTTLEGSRGSCAGFICATYPRRVLEFLAAVEPAGTTAGSAELIARLVDRLGQCPSSGGPLASDAAGSLYVCGVPAPRSRRPLELSPLLHPREGQAAQRAEGPHEIARRMALEAPAIAVEPFTPVASDNPARDLRDWTQLTVQELAAMCHVTARRFQHWLRGAAMSSKSEERLLRLHYLAGILAVSFGPAGARRWFRAPHPELGTTPIEAMVGGRDDTVQRLVERYVESPAT